MKPYSESCDQNQDPILEVIQPYFSDLKTVLEIGSGTGQHAVFFAEKMPHLHWQTSDQAQYHEGINAWLNDSALTNIAAPIHLNVDQDDWGIQATDAVFSANTVHIMSWKSAITLFKGVGKLLSSGGYFCLYGPFNYDGQFTSESNARFDVWLKQRDSNSGVRDFEAVNTEAEKAGLKLIMDHTMPANNRILVWQKQSLPR